MRTLIFAVAMLAAIPAFAQDWEYKVINLPTTIDPSSRTGMVEGALEEMQQHGGYQDNIASETLNSLAAEGWEVVNLTSTASGAGWGHFALLRRAKD